MRQEYPPASPRESQKGRISHPGHHGFNAASIGPILDQS
ncbi:hypothetical protein I546_0595 [Mycobacterium kansasii 732]|nr:hypothetical protein I546_0595 [Mycobacterium kansasii 732]